MLGGIVGPEPRVGQTRIADSARVGRLAKELGGSRRSWEPRMSWEARAGVGRLAQELGGSRRSWEARAYFAQDLELFSPMSSVP